MRCPRCRGYLWTEQERAGEHRECAERYGLDVVCIGGHRFTLTPEDFKYYLFLKGREKNVPEKNRRNQREASKH